MTKHTEEFTIPRRFGWGVGIKVIIECNPTDLSWVKLGLAVQVAHDNGASLVGASLVGASLDGARLVGARLDGARLDGARLVGASLDGARLVGARLDGARLDGASLVGASLDGASLDGASLVGARLDGARLVGASLVGASLDGARLVGASLVGASLDGASLDGAIYYDKKLKQLVACASRSDGYVFYAFEVEDGPIMIKAGCRWFSQAEFRDHVKTYGTSIPGIAKFKETSRILDFIDGRAKDLGLGAKPKRVRAKKVAA